METKDIIHNLNSAAVSFRGIPNELLLAIDEALKERDELRATLAIGKLQSNELFDFFMGSQRVNSTTWARIEGIINERDELRALLSSIQDSAECMPVPGGYAYTIDGAMMGQVDKALGEGE